jgi:U3 small nucleolar RNA-associated protein MPP10
MTKDQKTLDHFLSQVVEKPQVFFTSNQKIVDSALEMAKHFYDNVKKVEQVQFSPFTELLTEGFDNDQIWEEIASQNEPFLDYAKSTLKSLNKRPVKEVKFSDEEDESMSDQSMDLDQQEEDEDEDEEMQELDQGEELDQSEQEDHDLEEEESDEQEIIPEVVQDDEASEEEEEAP